MHLQQATRGRILVYTRCVRETHRDMHTAASLEAPAGSCRGYDVENVRPTPGEPQKHIKIEFTRCPDRCEAHPSLSLASGHEDVAPANDVRDRGCRSQMRLRPVIWGRKRIRFALAPPELIRPSVRASSSKREKREKKDAEECN